MKALVLTSNDEHEASMRFRVQAFLPYWRAAGHEAELSTFFASSGSWARRVVGGLARRSLDVVRSRLVDRLIVHREALPLSHNEFVRLLPSRTELIFDFDDAVFLPTMKGWRASIARPESTSVLVSRAARVYAGSEFLADYARRFSPHVTLMPTVVDTDRFRPRAEVPARQPVVGWVGSPSTARYLPQVLPALARVAKELPFTLRLIGAGRRFDVPGVTMDQRDWRLEDEVSAFQDLDVGLYPLEDDDWSRGKCGFKAVQYMACGVPFVVTPVGAVNAIVREGTDGLFARSVHEWTEHLLTLLREPSLGALLAASARARAVASYSVAALAPRWIQGVVAPREDPT
jgi:glycosyltransferase involved in cell wall biosynthesis